MRMAPSVAIVVTRQAATVCTGENCVEVEMDVVLGWSRDELLVVTSSFGSRVSLLSACCLVSAADQNHGIIRCQLHEHCCMGM